MRGFDSRRLHFFGRCANRGCDDAVGGLDLRATFDLELGDEVAKERFRLLWLGVGEDLVEVVSDRGEFRARRRVCALFGRWCGEFGLLAA